MTNPEKRWLGALLALCMLMGTFPVTWAAAEGAGTVAKGSYLDENGEAQSYEVHFDTPLSAAGGQLSAGNYYLAEDVDLTTDLTIVDNAVVKLDLAGHILRGTGNTAVITVGDNACVEVYDSDANADNSTPTTHYYTEDEDSVWVFDDTDASGTPWTGGVITGGGNADTSNRSRGGLYASYADYDPETSPIAISLFGGSACGNRCTSSRPSTGIVADSAKVFVAGGAVCGNQNGRCVQAPSFTLTGGLLQGDMSFSGPYGSIDIDGTDIKNGVVKKYPGSMVMHGGTIFDASVRIGNSASDLACKFTMYGGEITGEVDSGDNATDYLVGLFDADFEMYGGSIHEGAADHIILLSSIASFPGLESGYSSTFLLDGGIITNNAPRTNLVAASADECIIVRSGKITNNTCPSNTNHGTLCLMETSSGGEVIGAGTCVIEGGEISGNKHSGVVAYNSSSLSLSGAVKLTGNSSTSKGGDIRLVGGCKATIAGPLSNAEKISVSMDSPGVFTTGWGTQMGNAAPANYFVSAMDGYEVKPQTVDGVVEAALVEITAPTLTTGTVAKGSYMDENGETQSYEVSFDKPLTQTGGDLEAGNYYLPDDLTLTEPLVVTSDTVRLDLAGHILRGLTEISPTGELEIYDSDANEDNPNRTMHHYTVNEFGRWVFDDTNLSGEVWAGGVITTEDSPDKVSNALYLRSSDGADASVSLFQGAICGNQTATFCDWSGHFLMLGGAVCGNLYGLSVPDLTMTGGVISNNQDCGVQMMVPSIAGDNVQQIAAAPYNFVMRGGKITNNAGRGIIASGISRFHAPAVITMYGGEISGNRGGVCLQASAELRMCGGLIANNTALCGGGVYLQSDSLFRMDGGAITGNKANDGAGVWVGGSVDPDVTDVGQHGFYMHGGLIHENVATRNGGGVCVENGDDNVGAEFMLESGGISKNTAGGLGGGIYFSGRPTGAIHNGFPAMSIYEGGRVTGNRANNSGGGLFLANGINCKLVGCSITDNVATTNGGVYVSSAAGIDFAKDLKISENTTFDYKPSNVYLGSGVKITFGTAPITNSEKIGISLETPWTFDPWVFTSGWSYMMDESLPEDYFTIEMDGYKVARYDVYDNEGTVYGRECMLVPTNHPAIHTATFMVGDEVIGQVVFEEGATALIEPAIPQRPNYVGQWESYDLAAAKGDITVQGRYTPVDPDKVSDVETGAEAEYQGGAATVELFARAASKIIKVTTATTKPVDVVLVLDQSGSMADSLSNRDRQSKRDALVSCANAFAQELYQNAASTGADHRLAVVGFAYSAYNQGKYKNTGLLATPSGKSVNYASLKNSDYASALLPINSAGAINANVVKGINSIVADGATAADLGLTMARNIFEANPTQGARERVVIFITDGTPTAWGEDAALVRQTAAQAISMANTIKNGQDAKIYSVGVHANADPTAAFTSASDGVTTDWRGQFVSYDFNRFLHAVSSNYPDAQAMSDLGQGGRDGGFYMGVKDTGNLGNIFTNILYSTVYQLKTFDKANLSYTLDKEFTLTLEQEAAMRAQLKDVGLTDADIQVTRNDDGTTTLRFQNVRVKETYDAGGALCYEASVRFQASTTQTTQTGVITLPADGLFCESAYSPEHIHSYESAGQSGNCHDGLVTLYRCACGAEKSERSQPSEHSFTAVLAENGSSSYSLERVVCTKCGQSEEQDISFKVSYSQGWKTTVLDLNLLQNEVNVVEPEEKIELRFYVGEDGGKLYTVTRIDSDGKRTTYQTWAKNGYLVFEADHFSVYVIEEQDDSQAPEEQVSYEAAVDILESKEDIIMPGKAEVTEPTTVPDDSGTDKDNTGNSGSSTGGTTGGGAGGSAGGASGAAQPTAKRFADVEIGSWYDSGVSFVVEKGLFNGVSETSFAPGTNMTRAMWMTVLARLDGQDTSGGESWYQKGLTWAIASGISDGTAPEAEMTREQLVTMLYRYAKATPVQSDLTAFADGDSVSSWALEAVKWAVDQGLLKGKDGGRLDPQGTATRAEVATILQRYCEK